MHRSAYILPRRPVWQTLVFWLLALALALSFLGLSARTGMANEEAPDAPGKTIYLPFLYQDTGPLYIEVDRGPILLGVYPQNWWAPKPENVIKDEFQAIDRWSDQRMSLAGVYHTFDETNHDINVRILLSAIWDAGYTPFVNLHTGSSAKAIAEGQLDGQIQAWAKSFASFADGGRRMAFLAPLQEMNGYWVPYGLDPANFKLAYKRIQQIFDQAGVPGDSVRWVFAPNGYSDRRNLPFEDYYPGDDRVDVVSFSSYNFGSHPENPYKGWQNPWDVFAPYTQRLRQMAPTKPIFIAQTGTTAYNGGGQDFAAKNEWLAGAYEFLAAQPNVRGIVYYNADIDYDWSFYKPGGNKFEGYVDGVSGSDFDYVSPSELQDLYPPIR